ncbi:MAG: ChaN family lipoprotein [Nitrospira sp.]|jgi:uncharacterized iron-regulated protein|nr:ChaN family lipoprotein [Nitrospira sp.]
MHPPHRTTIFSRNMQRLSLCLAFAFLSLLNACAPTAVSTQGTSRSSVSVWQPGQIIDGKTGQVLDRSDWLKSLSQYDIVYLGEEHYNRHHIEAALTVLKTVMAEGIRPVLTMEMFGWDGQGALNDILSSSDPMDSPWLDRARWQQNWGGAYDNYAPLVAFARDQHLALYAMNPPKSLIRRVVTLRLDQARQEPEWTLWGMDREEIVDDPAYRSRILAQLQRCHGGGAEEDYLPMYEASMVRDEGMAKTVAQALRTARLSEHAPRTLILSYTGGGHIQYHLPVPKRVARRLTEKIAQTTVYLASYDSSRADDIVNLVQEGIADYIWLTPVSQQGLPQRCR